MRRTLVITIASVLVLNLVTAAIAGPDKTQKQKTQRKTVVGVIQKVNKKQRTIAIKPETSTQIQTQQQTIQQTKGKQQGKTVVVLVDENTKITGVGVPGKQQVAKGTTSAGQQSGQQATGQQSSDKQQTDKQQTGKQQTTSQAQVTDKLNQLQQGQLVNVVYERIATSPPAKVKPGTQQSSQSATQDKPQKQQQGVKGVIDKSQQTQQQDKPETKVKKGPRLRAVSIQILKPSVPQKK